MADWKMPAWAQNTFAAAILSLLGWLVYGQFEARERMASIDHRLAYVQVLESEMPTVLGVLKDHGTEMTALRARLDAYQNETNTLRRELKAEISDKTARRFTAADWMAAKENIDLRLQFISDKLARLEEAQHGHAKP